MLVRISLASMLTALTVLGASVVSIRAQGPEPGPSKKAVVPKADASAKEVAPEVAAPPTAAGAKTKSDTRSQAEIIADRLTRERDKAQAKRATRAARLARFQRWQIEWMIRQANFQIEYFRRQAALMEGIARQEAEARVARLRDDLNACGPAAVTIDDDDDYDDRDRYRPSLQEQVDAYNATTHQSFLRLAETLKGAILARQLQQGRAAVVGGGTAIYSPPNTPQGGFSWPNNMPINPVGGGTTIQPQPQPPTIPRNDTQNKTDQDIRNMIRNR